MGDRGDEFEVDSLIELDDAVAVVEVKSSVKSGVFEQLVNINSMIKKLFGKDKGVILIVNVSSSERRQRCDECVYLIARDVDNSLDIEIMKPHT